jgi:hypothetical protein
VAAGLIEDNVFNNPPFLGNANLGSGLFLSNLGSASGIPSGLPPSIWTTDPRWHTPYSQEWNFGIQQELAGGMLLDLGYVGTKGTHLTGVQDINQVLPGAAVAAGVVAPGAVYPGGTRAGEELNAYRPYVGWGSIGQITPSFDSNYNALQASVQKRFGHNSLLNIAYTWSHGMTDNQTDRSTGLQNTYCRVCDYGPSQLDRRHVFTANYVYDLPWLRDSHGVAGYVLGGWEASGILTVNSGLPLTVLTSRSNGDPAASGLNVDGAPNNGAPASPRPNQIGDPNVNAPKTWNQFFDTSMFVNPTVAQIYGGTERRGAVTGPGLWRYDMSLTKAFRITEGSNLQFRAEAFNLFNHTNFNGVGTTLGSATYGRVLSTRDPRIMQLALRFAF